MKFFNFKLSPEKVNAIEAELRGNPFFSGKLSVVNGASEVSSGLENPKDPCVLFTEDFDGTRFFDELDMTAKGFLDKYVNFQTVSLTNGSRGDTAETREAMSDHYWELNRDTLSESLPVLLQALSKIFEQNKTIERISEQIEKDPLTDLLNRRGLENRFKNLASLSERHSTPLTVVFVDIDNFKLYNDKHGHEQGDRLLQALSGVFLEALRSSDHVSRFGGDEFVLLLPHATAAEAFDISERLRKKIESANIPYAYTMPGGHLTVSMGIASWPDNVGDCSELLDCSDKALLEAKSHGKNKVMIYNTGVTDSREA